MCKKILSAHEVVISSESEALSDSQGKQGKRFAQNDGKLSERWI